jgi:hypothetical protein
MANATFSKNRETGEWDVRGPADAVLAGNWVTVSKANGTTTRIYVATVSRAFLVNGVAYVFGTIGKAPAKTAAPKAAPAPTPAPEPVHFGAPVTTVECDDCSADCEDLY